MKMQQQKTGLGPITPEEFWQRMFKAPYPLPKGVSDAYQGTDSNRTSNQLAPFYYDILTQGAIPFYLIGRDSGPYGDALNIVAAACTHFKIGLQVVDNWDGNPLFLMQPAAANTDAHVVGKKADLYGLMRASLSVDQWLNLVQLHNTETMGLHDLAQLVATEVKTNTALFQAEYEAQSAAFPGMLSGKPAIIEMPLGPLQISLLPRADLDPAARPGRVGQELSTPYQP